MKEVCRSIKEKKSILSEAYSRPNNIKQMAQKYNVQPCLIRHWKAALHATEAAFNINGNAEITTFEIRKLYNKKILHSGRKTKISDEHCTDLIKFYSDRRNEGMVITVKMLAVELIRMEPTLAGIPFHHQLKTATGMSLSLMISLDTFIEKFQARVTLLLALLTWMKPMLILT